MNLRYFKVEEFACKHCGKNLIDASFLEELDELRHRCGFPFVIVSGYRCPDHNAAVSATGRTGPHTTGRASDVAVSHGQAFTLMSEAMLMGFTGIGVQQKGAGRYVHLDTLPNSPGQPRPTVWSY